MKRRAFLVYYADNSANVVIADNVMSVLFSSNLPDEKKSKIVKIELIPFELI